jgi:hypothetical protein
MSTASQTVAEQTLTEALAEIGVSHWPSQHYGCRTLATETGQVIDALDVGWAWDFVHAAQAAA